MKHILLVDGYNVIGAWPELQKLKRENLEDARNLLLDKMAEYQARTGFRVIVIFDAYDVNGTETTFKKAKVEVIFTKKNQTADEKIEQLAIQMKKVTVQIHVATSDYTEQWAIFGQGALRISARELLREMNEIEAGIDVQVKEVRETKLTNKWTLNEKVLEKLEEIRRRK